MSTEDESLPRPTAAPHQANPLESSQPPKFMPAAAVHTISELASSLDSTLSSLELALAKLQGPVQPGGSTSASPQRNAPTAAEAAASSRLEFSSLVACRPGCALLHPLLSPAPAAVLLLAASLRFLVVLVTR